MRKLEDTFVPVIVESPFKSNEESSEEEHMAYLERCLLDCVNKGETPYASHKMLTKCLDDSIPEQRALGISAGLAMARILARHGGVPTFYLDYGWSIGMREAKRFYEAHNIPIVQRWIGRDR